MDDNIQNLRDDIKEASTHLKANTLTSSGTTLLSQQLTDMRDDCERVARNNNVLASLRYSEIHDRHSQIVNAHHKTFEWIFDPTQSHDHSIDRPVLDEWLRERGGI